MRRLKTSTAPTPRRVRRYDATQRTEIERRLKSGEAARPIAKSMGIDVGRIYRLAEKEGIVFVRADKAHVVEARQLLNIVRKGHGSIERMRADIGSSTDYRRKVLAAFDELVRKNEHANAK